MASQVDLDTLVGFGKAADAALAKIVKAVMQANNWKITGACMFQEGPTGYLLHVDRYPGPITAIVASGGITARVNSTTLGQGNAVLWPRSGATIAAGSSPVTVKVFNSFAVAHTSGTFIEVLPDGADYKIVGADCPP